MLAEERDSLASEELVSLIAKKFIERRDVKAEQHSNGAYSPIESKFTKRDLHDHLTGTRTYGHYMVAPGSNTARLFAFDIDLAKSASPDMTGNSKTFYTWTGSQFIEGSPRVHYTERNPQLYMRLTEELLVAAVSLAVRTRRLLGIQVAIAFSGSKGVHVYGFTGRDQAETIREAAHEVIHDAGVWQVHRGKSFYRHSNEPKFGLPNIDIEVYPKQGKMDGKAYGNLMRLPLGIHRRTGARSYFLQVRSFTAMNQQISPEQALRGEVEPWA